MRGSSFPSNSNETYPDNYGTGCNNNNDCAGGYSCDEDSGIYEVSFETVFTVSDQFDHNQSLEMQWGVYDGTNDTVFSEIIFDVAEFNTAPTLDYQVREVCGVIEQLLIPDGFGADERMISCSGFLLHV